MGKLFEFGFFFLIVLLLAICLSFLSYKVYNLYFTKPKINNNETMFNDTTIYETDETDETDETPLSPKTNSILKYKGLDSNPNRLAIGFYSDHIKPIDIDKLTFISNHDLDIFFGMHYITFVSAKHFISATTVIENEEFKFNKNYNMFLIKYTYANINDKLYHFFFNKKLNVKLISNYNVFEIKNRKYFYAIFKIKDLTKNNSITLDHVLNVILNFVLEIDAEEIKKEFKNTVFHNTIYLINKFENDIPKMDYTNEIISQEDVNNFRDPRNKFDKRNIKYMLLHVN